MSRDEARTITLSELSGAAEIVPLLHRQPLPPLAVAKLLWLEKWYRPHYERFVEARLSAAKKLGRQVSDTRWEVPMSRSDELVALLAPAGLEILEVPRACLLNVSELAGLELSPGQLASLGPLIADLWGGGGTAEPSALLGGAIWLRP